MATVWTWSSSASVEPEQFNGTAPTIDTGGSFGERYLWPPTTAQSFARKTLALAADFQTRFIYTIANAASTSHMIFSANDSGTSYQMRIDLTAAGLLRLRADSVSGGLQVAQGTVGLEYGVEHRFEVSRAGATATVKAYRVSDNVLRDTISGTVGTAAIANLCYGNNLPVTGTLGAFSFDEIIVNNVVGDIGPVAGVLVATATLSPTSVGQGSTLTLVITASGGNGGPYSYQVTNWGDGSLSPAQSTGTFTKAIASNAVLGAKTVSWSVTG